MENQLPQQITPRIFIVCDQDATAPIWGHIIREKGLVAILETSVERAIERSVEVIPDLIVIDVNASHSQRMDLCRQFRALSPSPILLFLPVNHEPEILEAYRLGVDECVIKPISPGIFLAKILAWSRRSWNDTVKPRQTGRLRLDPSHRSAVGSNKKEVKLTNLEFRVLQILMSRPGYVFSTEEIIQTVWGDEGDAVLLKNVVYRLRKKLEDEADVSHLIKTWHRGYSFMDE